MAKHKLPSLFESLYGVNHMSGFPDFTYGVGNNPNNGIPGVGKNQGGTNPIYQYTEIGEEDSEEDIIDIDFDNNLNIANKMNIDSALPRHRIDLAANPKGQDYFANPPVNALEEKYNYYLDNLDLTSNNDPANHTTTVNSHSPFGLTRRSKKKPGKGPSQVNMDAPLGGTSVKLTVRPGSQKTGDIESSRYYSNSYNDIDPEELSGVFRIQDFVKTKDEMMDEPMIAAFNQHQKQIKEIKNMIKEINLNFL